MYPHRYSRRRALKALVGGTGALLGLCACQKLFQPWEQAGGQTSAGPEQGAPALLRLAAAWPALPLAEALVAAYAPDASRLAVDIIPCASHVAAELASAGQADLAFLEQEEWPSTTSRASGRSSAGERTLTLALNAVGVIVPQARMLRTIATAELAQLFAGLRLDWSELGAGNGPIELVSQEKDAVARHVFEAHVMKERAIATTAVLMPHDRGVWQYVVEHEGAIGYGALAYQDERARLVALDGVLPTAADVRRRRYALAYPLVALIPPQAPAEASRLVAYALSGKGRAIIESRYILPA